MAYALLIEGACTARRAKLSRGVGRPAAAVFAALLALAAAGCFTGPINHPPGITFVEGSSTPSRKQAVSYTVQATDPDGDRTSVVWDQVQGTCTPETGPESWPLSKDAIEAMGDQSNTLMLDATQTDTPFCLWAFAIDSHGAITPVHLAVVPADAAPTANIQVVAPPPVASSTTDVLYPLYSTIELSSDDSTDPEDDSLNRCWSPKMIPAGSKAALVDCNSGAPVDCTSGHICFTADLQGNYQVALVVTDSGGKSNSVSRQISVNSDQPPCIAKTTPSLVLTPIQYDSKENNPSRISVDAVHDDGDPYPSPGSTLQFRWSTSTNGGPFAPVEDDVNFLPLDNNQAPGTLVKVRVEVLDRNPTTAAALRGCGNDKDFCYTDAGNTCPQRVSWSIEY